MEITELELIIKAISNFKNRKYDENQFHSTFATVVGMITESHNYEIRQRLESIESSLEVIDYMSNNKHEDYLHQIEKIENILKANKLLE
jgi:hypothetical protein